MKDKTVMERRKIIDRVKKDLFTLRADKTIPMYMRNSVDIVLDMLINIEEQDA